jgi:hypothetical protein
VNACLNNCPALRYLLGLVLLMLTLLVLEAAVVTAIDVTIHNTGLQRGIVMTEGALKRFNLLNLLLSLSCEARTGTIIEVYAMVGRFAGLAILLLHIVSRLVLSIICTSLAHFTPMTPMQYQCNGTALLRRCCARPHMRYAI